METNDETNNANEHNMVKNPNWQEANQLAIYKRGRGVELGTTEKQLQLSGPQPPDLKSSTLTTGPCCLLVCNYYIQITVGNTPPVLM